VFAGGGARGFAHLGTWQALHEQGIEVDCVGGTSIGAAMAAAVAADQPLERTIAVTRKASRESDGRLQLAAADLADQGRARAQAIYGALRELVGEPIAVEDLWKTYFCVATNYTQASEHRIDAATSRMRCSRAWRSGALPPVVRDGDLLCDGGTFNNFPWI